MRTIVTAIFNGYERPKAPPLGFDRRILITDSSQDARWEVRRRNLNGLSHARIFFNYKLVPHVSISPDEHDMLWIDGSFEPTGESVDSLFDLVPQGGVGIYKHPVRDCFYDEAMFSAGNYSGRDRGEMAAEQGEFYKSRGCPLHGGLWATGIIVWRGAQRRLGERWFAEMQNWSASDQVSLPYVVHALRETVTTIPGDVYASKWFHYVPHGQAGRTTL
jgi:hypothetical protein